jgi:hypothetical protein
MPRPQRSIPLRACTHVEPQVDANGRRMFSNCVIPPVRQGPDRVTCIGSPSLSVAIPCTRRSSRRGCCPPRARPTCSSLLRVITPAIQPWTPAPFTADAPGLMRDGCAAILLYIAVNAKGGDECESYAHRPWCSGGVPIAGKPPRRGRSMMAWYGCAISPAGAVASR